jgi:hypothetical protein
MSKGIKVIKGLKKYDNNIIYNGRNNYMENYR